MKLLIFKRRRRIRALIVGLAALAIAVPVASGMPVAPGQHRDAGLSGYVDNRNVSADAVSVVGPPSAGYVDSRTAPALSPASGYVDYRPGPSTGTSDVAARPGGRLMPVRTPVLAQGPFEWTNFAIGVGIVLCVLLAGAAGLFLTRRREHALGA